MLDSKATSGFALGWDRLSGACISPAFKDEPGFGLRASCALLSFRAGRHHGPHITDEETESEMMRSFPRSQLIVSPL